MAEQTVQIKSSLAAVQDHARQFSDFTFVYPVISRRSRGLSIGINLNPDKVCNFDCIYCEVDRTIPGQVSKVDLHQMRDELAAMIHFARDGGQIKEVHAYTIARPTPEVFAAKLCAEELTALAETVRQKTGLPVLTFD